MNSTEDTVSVDIRADESIDRGDGQDACWTAQVTSDELEVEASPANAGVRIECREGCGW